MHCACFWSSGSTLKPCFSTVTSGLAPPVEKPSFDIQDRNGYLLPENQTPSVLPLKSSGLVIPLPLRQVSSMRDLSKTCAILTSATPFSRVARADGIQSTTTSAPPPAMTWDGLMSGPPGLIVTSSPASL